MHALTRCRSPDADPETWFVNYVVVRVGIIGRRAGVPADAGQWCWAVGFDPAADHGLRASGTAKTFEAARAVFDLAWQWRCPMLAAGYRLKADDRSTCLWCGDWDCGYGKPRLGGAYRTG